MNVHAGLLGLHQPGEGWLFWLGVEWKYLLMLTLSLPALIIQAWPVTLAVLALTTTLLTSSGIDPIRMLRIGWAMWLILGLLTAYQLMVLNPRVAMVMPGNLLLTVLAAYLLTLTIPTLRLLDALIVALRPARFVGLNPEQVTLVVALMIRSVPYLLGLFGDVRDVARARGAGRSVVTLLMSAMLSSVAHAERADKALAARRLGEHEQ